MFRAIRDARLPWRTGVRRIRAEHLSRAWDAWSRFQERYKLAGLYAGAKPPLDVAAEVAECIAELQQHANAMRSVDAGESEQGTKAFYWVPSQATPDPIEARLRAADKALDDELHPILRLEKVRYSGGLLARLGRRSDGHGHRLNIQPGVTRATPVQQRVRYWTLKEAPENKGLRFQKVSPITWGMKYGYVRVSTNEQNPAMQLAALKKAGCKTVFKDEVTGAHVKRPSLTRCPKILQPGDTLIVWKLDRLGRSLRDLIHMLDGFKQQRIKFQSLTEAIDTETPTGRAMWQMIGVLAELERSLITERTRAGVKDAQRRGVKFGRKIKLTPDRLTHARKLIDQGRTPTEAAKIVGVGRAILYGALQRADT